MLDPLSSNFADPSRESPSQSAADAPKRIVAPQSNPEPTRKEVSPTAPEALRLLSGPTLPNDPKRFQSYSGTLVLEGDPHKPLMVLVGGLAHTRFPVTPLGMLLHKHTGCTTMLCSLPILKNLERGTDPMSKEEIADALSKDISERAVDHPGLVAVGYSTGGLGILELANRGIIKPSGLACIGVPLHLKNPLHQTQLDDLLQRAEGHAQSMIRFVREPLFHRYARSRWVPVEPLPTAIDDRLEQKNAYLTGIYVETLLALRQYQQEIRKGLPNITCPTFIAVGRNDSFATVDCALALGGMIGGSSRIHIYDHSPHGVQLGPERRRFYRDFFAFIERDLKLLPEEQSKLIQIRDSAA